MLATQNSKEILMIENLNLAEGDESEMAEDDERGDRNSVGVKNRQFLNDVICGKTS